MQAILVKPRYNMPAAGCIMRFFVSGNSEILGELMPRGFFFLFFFSFFSPLGQTPRPKVARPEKLLAASVYFVPLLWLALHFATEARDVANNGQ